MPTPELLPFVSALSTVEWAVSDVRRALSGAAYPAGQVTVSVRLYDVSFLTPLGAEIPATFDPDVEAFVALIPPVGQAVGRVGVLERVTAAGRVREVRHVVEVAA